MQLFPRYTMACVPIVSFFLCAVLLNSGKAAASDPYIPGPQRRTYADHLHRTSLAVQHANNASDQEHVQHLNDLMYQMYWPVEQLILERITMAEDQVDGFVDTKTKISQSQMEKDEEHPLLLRTILASLQEAGENGNMTSACTNDTGGLIVGLLHGSPWALQFLDATGKPGPSLGQYHLNLVGNYEQCRAASAPTGISPPQGGYTGNYCIVGLNTYNPFMMVQLGSCLPSSCSSGEVTVLMRNIVKRLSSKIPEQIVFAECLTAPTEVTTATVFAILILSLCGALMILGTIYDLMFMARNSKDDKNQLVVNNGHDPDKAVNGYQSISNGSSREGHTDYSETSSLINSTNTEQNRSVSTSKNSSVLAKVLIAFSVYSNGKKLLSTSNTNAGNLSAVHGIRFLSMSWVVLCHVFAFIVPFTMNSSAWAPKWINRWTTVPITNGYSSVDTFFTLSGLLTSYLTIKEMMRKNTWKINWPMFYFHRFWRLTPPYMFAIVIVLGFTQYLGQGPMWQNVQPGDKAACENNWWTNLLYVNNLVKTDMSCFGHAWYLANDMQFFVISPLLLIPFFFHRLAGIASCLLLLFVHMVTTGTLSSVRDWPTTTTTLKPMPGRAGQPEWFNDYYIVPWCRIGPFIVGIMAGYVLAITKGRQFRMPSWVVALGWIVCLASGLAVVYGLRGDITGENPSSIATAAFYNAVSRSVWGVCVSWVIIACSAGYGGPVNTLLSWSPFVVLGRLTYMCYLIHLTIGSVFYQNLGALLYVNDTTVVLVYLGILCFANMAAFLGVLILESPMIGLERAFFRKDR